MNKITNEFTIPLSIILFATLTRIAIPPFLGHPPNFSAVDASALFCGAYFSRRLTACMLVLFSVWIGDLFLNKYYMGHWELFYSGFYWQYGSYCLIVFLGAALKNRIKPTLLLFSSLASAILFFVISNFGVWASGLLYPLTLDGLIACYVAAIPFFKNTLFSDVLFTMVLFGSFELIRVKLPSQQSIKNSI